MNYSLRILDVADADLDEAAQYIAQDSLDAVLRFYDSASLTFDKIAQDPKLYARYQGLSLELRDLHFCSIVGFPNHLVFYHVMDDVVLIVRVIHGMRFAQRSLT